jgi:enoyl-CoA hydratase/carnithine racemase
MEIDKLSTVRIREDDGICHAILNSPPRNTMSTRFFQEFSFLADTHLPNLDVQGMLLYGAGRHFSSGADVDQLTARSFLNDYLERNSSSFQRLASLSYPVVAVIRGCCFGSGAELALSCDFRVAAGNAVIAFPEVQFGLMPGCGGSIGLPRLVGTGKAIELLLTGKVIMADDALRAGLVDMVVDRKQAVGSAVRLVHSLRGLQKYNRNANPAG